MPHNGTAPARYPLFLLAQTEALGLDSERLLKEASLSWRELGDPDARIQARKDFRLWAAVFETIGDRVEFGFEPLSGHRVFFGGPLHFDQLLSRIVFSRGALYRAFRRWTDASPREYRAAKEDS